MRSLDGTRDVRWRARVDRDSMDEESGGGGDGSRWPSVDESLASRQDALVGVSVGRRRRMRMRIGPRTGMGMGWGLV